MQISQSLVRDLFSYLESGALIWREYRASNAPAGSVAGYIKESGYRYVSINGRRYLAHRIVFLYHHGSMPIRVDHINGNRDDNRIENLREATPSQNNQNAGMKSTNTSGVKGVSWCKRRNRWKVSICTNYRKRHVGYFADLDKAAEAYRAAAAKYHGEFAKAVCKSNQNTAESATTVCR